MTHHLFKLLALTLIAGPALASRDADLLHCRTFRDVSARLACYDALPLTASVNSTVAPSSPPAPATPATPRAAATGFGLTPAQLPVEQQVVQSHIEGLFEGWTPGTRIKLANGQVWVISDDSIGAFEFQDPKVKIERGALGGYLMTIEGISRVPRVRRLQ